MAEVVAALSAGEAGVEPPTIAYDEYAGEAGSAGEEGFNADCGDSAGKGSD